MACKYKRRVWENGWCNVACSYCTFTQESTCSHNRQTNAERIRSMTDEELAKLLLDGCRGSECNDQPQNEFGSVNCFECRMKWLQQPYEEDR